MQESIATTQNETIKQKMQKSIDSDPDLMALAKYGITMADIRALPDTDDKAAFKPALMALLARIPDPAPLAVQQASESIAKSAKEGSIPKLLAWDTEAPVRGLAVNGDKASGTIRTISTFNGVPVDTSIAFERINNRWRISLRGRAYFDN